LTVLVTGAGGPAGVAVIRALVARGVEVVAADADPLGVGLRLAQQSACVPRCDDPAFVDALCGLARRTGSDVLIPTLSEELLVLAPHQGWLADAGLRTWIPARVAIETCIDKWRFAGTLRANGIPGPCSALGEVGDVPGPWIVKPRFGRGSRDVYSVDEHDEVEWALRRVPAPIVQQRLSGREFTVDSLVARDGTLAGAVPRWRVETKAGISTKGTTFDDPAVIDVVRRTLGAVGLTGAANVQGFVTHDGRAHVIEVNPRFSGGLPLSLAAGADFVGEYVRGVEGFEPRPAHLQFRTGVTMLRYFAEVFE
jgi:carbamoyl-phosphate synthase large subunit